MFSPSRAALLAALLALATPFAQAADRHIHTYAMKRTLPEQVLPALEPLISPGSSAQAFQNQLILNVTDAEYASVQELLAQLDVAARSLLISVRKAGATSSDDSAYGIDGRIGRGDVQMQTGSSRNRTTERGPTERGPTERGPTEIYAEQHQRQGQSGGSQQVRAVEGMPAFISAGTAQMMTTQRSPYGSTRELIPVESGFYATARVIGSEVVIDIDQRDDRAQGRNIQTQSLQTQVRGRVGEWIPLGGLNRSESGSDAGLTSRGNYAQSAQSDLALKVELAP